MSRIGKKPIAVPKSVKVELKGQDIKVTGPLGTLQMDVHPEITVSVNSSAGQIMVENKRPQLRQNRQMHGTTRAIIANMVTGVTNGFEKKMHVYGTGYSVKEQGGNLVLQVGFSHPVKIKIPKDIKVNIQTAATRGNEVPAVFTVSGIDKGKLGQFTAELRKIKPPEPYKGKGIRYADEQVRRKVGKAFTSGAV